MNSQEIKKEIRRLKRLKLSLRSGSKERIDLHRAIVELKKQLEQANIVDKSKEALVEAIRSKDKLFDTLNIDLYKFSIEELQKHIDKLKSKEIK